MDTLENSRIRVPRTIDREATFFALPGEYLLVWAGIAFGCLALTFLLSYIVPVHSYLWLAATVVLGLAHLVLFGSEPWKFGGKFIRSKNWVKGRSVER